MVLTYFCIQSDELSLPYAFCNSLFLWIKWEEKRRSLNFYFWIYFQEEKIFELLFLDIFPILCKIWGICSVTCITCFKFLYLFEDVRHATCEGCGGVITLLLLYFIYIHSINSYKLKKKNPYISLNMWYYFFFKKKNYIWYFCWNNMVRVKSTDIWI